jgi:LmbE family N-acetylglucosaminyl deacetylase
MSILALSPHTDDVEFACGGSIHKWVKEGQDVHIVSFTAASALKEEFFKAAKALGVRTENTTLLQYKVRHFPMDRQRILEQLVALERRIRPSLVLIPASSDTHQDHQVIREEGFRAFKRTSLIGYEMPQNNLSFNTNMFVKLSDANLNAKFRALVEYKSQANRPYITHEFIKGLAQVRGMQAGTQYAEAYEVIRWMA